MPMNDDSGQTVGREKDFPVVAILIDNLNEESRDRDPECYPPFADFVAKNWSVGAPALSR